MAERTEWYRIMLNFVADMKGLFNEHSDQVTPEMLGFFADLERMIISIADVMEVQSAVYPNIKAVVSPLAQRGWFISAYLRQSQMLDLGQRCLHVPDAELDLHLLQMYRESVDDISQSLIDDFPERAFAIRPATEAHKRGEYALSVPVFFAQAEGISFSTLNKYLFTDGKVKKGGISENIKTSANERLEEIQQFVGGTPFEVLGALHDALWRPFLETLPIAYGPKDRLDRKYFGLNRNTVMHGLALEEYATEENSLKALSLLSSVASLAQAGGGGSWRDKNGELEPIQS